MNTITEKLKFANWFIDNVLCVDIEYIKYRLLYNLTDNLIMYSQRA